MTTHPVTMSATRPATSDSAPRLFGMTPLQWGLLAVMAVGAVLMVLPFFWMASTACKSAAEVSSTPIRWLPSQPQCAENLRALYAASPNFNRFLANTALVTVARVVGQVVMCALAAYGFARFRFPGRGLLFAACLGLLMVPYQAILIPQYVLVNRMGVLNTLPGVILPNLFSAFALFLLRQAFLQIPVELEEAAEIDGANPLQVLLRVVLPLSAPALAAFAVISTQAAWNDFLWPLVAANSANARVVTVGIALLQGERGTPWNLIMMGALIATLPMVVLFALLQRTFIEGVALTGLNR